jgi:hypothetical protein
VKGFWYSLAEKTGAQISPNGLNSMRFSENDVGFVERVISNESASKCY